MPGVLDVVQIPDGVAVVADTYWHACKAREALRSCMGRRRRRQRSTPQPCWPAPRRRAGTGKPLVLKTVGDPEAAINAADAKVGARRVHLPLNLSHSPMEPMNFTAWYRDNKMDLIGPTQWQDAAQSVIAKAVDVDPATVSLQTTFLGGGFGRRIDIDFIIQAAQISQGRSAKPVKLLWTREDDMTHDFYRPQSVHTASPRRVGRRRQADGDDVPHDVAVDHRPRLRPAGRGAGPADDRGGDGAPTRSRPPGTTMVKHDAGLRVGYWRSVSHFQNAFANEGFIDELAAAAKADPVAYRMSLLSKLAALRRTCSSMAADKSGLGHAGAGRTRAWRGADGGLRHLHGAWWPRCR